MPDMEGVKGRSVDKYPFIFHVEPHLQEPLPDSHHAAQEHHAMFFGCCYQLFSGTDQTMLHEPQ